MSYIAIAIVAYFFLALSQVLDKFLLSDRIPKPSVYAFYVALLSLITVIIIPPAVYFLWYFDILPELLKYSQVSFLYPESTNIIVVSIIAGMVFLYHLLFFYRALKFNEISRVAPLVGSAATIFTTLLSGVLLEHQFSLFSLVGILFLFTGGFFISFDLPIKSLKIFNGFRDSMISAMLFAFAYVFFNIVYKENMNFFSGYAWTRLGIFIGGLSLILIPNFRKEIYLSFMRKEVNKKKSLATMVLFIGNKILGGSHSVLISYAIKLGSVAIVGALNSIQFVFVLVVTVLMAFKYPKLFGEKLFFWDWAQKVGAIALIGMGIALVSI